MNYFSKYIFVGLFNTIVGYSVIFFLMYILGASPEISNIAGYGVGLVLSYFLNRTFVFNSDEDKQREFSRFIMVFCIAYAANFLTLLVFINHLDARLGLSQIIAGIVYTGTSFFMNKYYVFKPYENRDGIS